MYFHILYENGSAWTISKSVFEKKKLVFTIKLISFVLQSEKQWETRLITRVLLFVTSDQNIIFADISNGNEIIGENEILFNLIKLCIIESAKDWQECSMIRIKIAIQSLNLMETDAEKSREEI